MRCSDLPITSYIMVTMLPRFPDFRDIDLSHQNIFHDFLSRSPLEGSEYNFTNLFAFRKAYGFRISLLHDNLIIFRDSGHVSSFCPVGSSRILNTLHEIYDFIGARTNGAFLERVPESFVSAHLKDVPDLTCEEERDHFDYVYLVQDLAKLRGNRFHDKKNKINKFKSLYRYRYETLTPELIPECLEYEEEWCEVRDCGKIPGLEKERCAILEMLNNFSTLRIKGGIIRVDKKIVALTLGEKFLHDTIVIHIEKANSDMPGLYQVINQEFLKHEAKDCTYVNREQDLGISGLRKSKMSYNPLHFIKKYNVRKRKP